MLRCKLVVRRQILAREKTIELESMIETYIVAIYSRAYISKKREIAQEKTEDILGITFSLIALYGKYFLKNSCLNFMN